MSRYFSPDRGTFARNSFGWKFTLRVHNESSHSHLRVQSTEEQCRESLSATEMGLAALVPKGVGISASGFLVGEGEEAAPVTGMLRRRLRESIAVKMLSFWGRVITKFFRGASKNGLLPEALSKTRTDETFQRRECMNCSICESLNRRQ